MSDYRERCLTEKGNVCIICGEEENIDVHHIDGNRTNNSIENLIPVCRYCHIGIHEARENYKHWYNRLLPWYTDSNGNINYDEIANEEKSPNHNLIDNLIFLEGLTSSAARRLIEIENGDTPFQCPDCSHSQTLGSEYSMNNRTTCPNCGWSGAVYEGTLDALGKDVECTSE